MNKKLAGMFLSLALLVSCRNNEDKPPADGMDATHRELLKIGKLAIECGSKVTNLEKQVKSEELIIKALEEKDSINSLIIEHQDQLTAILGQQAAQAEAKGDTIKDLKITLESLLKEKKEAADREKNGLSIPWNRKQSWTVWKITNPVDPACGLG